jgi:hypothetical protein
LKDAPTLIPLLSALIVLGVGNMIKDWFNRKHIKQEREHRESLQTWASHLRQTDDHRRIVDGDGQLIFSFTGTAAASWMPAWLTSFVRGGVTSFVGPALLNEPAKSDRDAASRSVPPELLNRIHIAQYPHLSGGLGGASIPQALGMREDWERDATIGATTWREGIDRHRAIAEVDPMLHVAAVSPGGSAVTAKVLLDEFAYHYRAPQFVVTAMDHKDPVRRRFGQMRQYLSQADNVRGFIVCDNALDMRRNDFGLVQLFAAMVSGVWLSTNTLGALNSLTYLFPSDEPARVATLSVWAESLPVFYRPQVCKDLPAMYYSNSVVCREKIMRGIKAVIEKEADSLRAVAMPRADKGNVAAVYVVAPLEPESFRREIPEIEERMTPWLQEYDRNVTLQFASIGQPLTPTGTAMITVIMLQSVAGSGQDVDQYTLDTLVGAEQKAIGSAPSKQERAVLRAGNPTDSHSQNGDN